MVLTLKVISCAINYSDGLLKEEGLRDAQKKNRLLRRPSIIEYVGYCLCCGSHFAGPVYEMKDYLEWTEKQGVGTSGFYLWCCWFFNFVFVKMINVSYLIFCGLSRFGLVLRTDHYHPLILLLYVL